MASPRRFLAIVAVILVGVALVTWRSLRPVPVEAATLAPVVIVMMENKEDVRLKPSNAPYLMSLKTQGRYFSRYYGVVHPSFPNYLAATAGSTFGFVPGSIKAGMIDAPSIWDQLSGAGRTWGVYQELMPTRCYAKPSYIATSPTKDKYGIGHNPGVVYSGVYGSSTKCQNVRPLSQMPSTLPALSFVTPSYCNDMHGFLDTSYPADCQRNNVSIITRGDRWLRDHVETWRAAGAIVIVTFDEGTTDAGTGGHIYTVAVGPGIAPAVNGATYDHYSLLAGLEDRFGLARLGHAASARPLPIG